MPTAYVRKLANKHGISTSTAEKHWSKAKTLAEKEGKGENYAYVTSIFKNMMHESVFIPTLKDLTRGMTFKYFLVAEADGSEVEKQHSPVYNHLADRFPQFVELSFKARREIEKEVSRDGLLDDYEMLSQEEKDSVDSAIQDIVIDKMQAEVGVGHNFRDWQKDDEEYAKRKAEFDAQQGDVDDAAAALAAPAVEKQPRRSSGPRHIAAMRQRNVPAAMPQDDDMAVAANASGEEQGPVSKSYYKKWSDLSDEQRAARSKLAQKHGMIYRVKGSKWFRVLSPEQQQAIIGVLKSGGDLQSARAAGGLGGAPQGEV